MELKKFDYNLPKNLIAQKPISPRDHSRLLLLSKKNGRILHKHFYDIIDYLKSGDVLVLNNTKVMAARLIGKRAITHGKVEVFLLNKVKTNIWECLIGGHKRKENLEVEFSGGLKAKFLKNNFNGTWNVKFNKSGADFMKLINKIGRVPLPPYIKREQKLKSDQKNYQTIYADDKKIGSVAAPTAGFHFTKKLINQLKKKGVQFEYVTLQVGLGTFAPVKVDDITKHKMHAEYVEVNKKTINNIIKAKKQGRRIIAVGTTSVRTLESVFKKVSVKNQAFWTDIFIYPGYKFKIIDGLITNFHLPKSTLLMLVSAFASREKIFKAYQQAIKKKYRFFSYGDAMLII
jgi:S-adenosylmethionine:tRNA ribosyltransferase-isomerase